MITKRRIVLVHGAWTDARTWDDVAARLRAVGHDVTAVDLPSHGSDVTPPEKVGLTDYASRVAEALSDGEPALLVGHSMGGMSISVAGELLPEKVRKLAYVAAFLPRDGQSLLDLITQQDEPGLRDIVLPGDLPGSSVLDANQAAEILFQDANPAQRGRGLAGLGPQPVQAHTDRANLSPGRFGALPRAYIVCDQDRTVTPTLQRQMATDSPCHQVFTIDCGHLPQLTRPDALAAILSRL